MTRALFVLALLPGAYAQTFEVASVHAAAPGERRGPFENIHVAPAGVTLTQTTCM